MLIHVCSVQFSLSVVSDSLWPRGLQHTRSPGPSPTPRVYSNSCPLSRWWHSTISSSVFSFSSCLQSFPVSGSFPMSQLFASGGQSIGASASASILPMHIQIQEIVCAERQKGWVQGLVPLLTIHVPCNKSLSSLSLNFFMVTRDN